MDRLHLLLEESMDARRYFSWKKARMEVGSRCFLEESRSSFSEESMDESKFVVFWREAWVEVVVCWRKASVEVFVFGGKLRWKSIFIDKSIDGCGFFCVDRGMNGRRCFFWGEESKDGSRRPPQHRQRNHSETTARPPALADTSLRARRLHLHDGCFQHRP